MTNALGGYTNCCSLMSGTSKPSIWTFNCPCPLIRTKHKNRLDHVCCFQERPSFSHSEFALIDTWQVEFDALCNAFLSYHAPTSYPSAEEVSRRYIKSSSSNEVLSPPPSCSQSSSSSDDDEDEEMRVKRARITPTLQIKQRAYSRFDDFLALVETNALLLRTKQCNRLPHCHSAHCTYNHTVAESLALFHNPIVIRFFKEGATIRERERRPMKFQVQATDAFQCIECRNKTCSTFQLTIILYSKTTRLLQYPTAFIVCHLCERKTSIPIYL